MSIDPNVQDSSQTPGDQTSATHSVDTVSSGAKRQKQLAVRRFMQGSLLLLGFAGALFASASIGLGTPLFWLISGGDLVAITYGVGYAALTVVVTRLTRFAQVEAGGVVFLAVLIVAAMNAGYLASRGLPASLLLILPFYGLAFFFLLLWAFFRKSVPQRPFYAVPGGIVNELLELTVFTENYDLRVIENPAQQEPPAKAAGIVVDMTERREAEWVRFLSQCSLRGIEVVAAEEVYESLTGRVSLRHLSEGVLETFRVSLLYRLIKRLNGVVFLLVSLPFALPVALITALAIKIDSRGPLIFTQERVGEGGNIFRMHKFRSMHVDAELGGARFAQSEDERVTRVGRFIRRYRLDELPQFANILKGQMSLIGPRPEQVGFVKQFEKEIPFYGYRHLVKPGITGWAQVNHGYAADEKETRTKLEHDLYYVKHFSIWIDVLIGLKTFRTIITGFGAR